MITAEEKLQALRLFVGDVVVYADKSILLRSTNPNLNEDAYGRTWDEALEHLIRLQRKAQRALATSNWFPTPIL